MELHDYKAKRDLKKTAEPAGSKRKKSKDALRFVIQKHDARRLHYDFRIECDGVLLSWAVPKGPSLNPNDKRLAMHVEDHPLEYQYFEGIIPKGNYGAGTVEIWDAGTYITPDSKDRDTVEKAVREGHRKGHIAIVLQGKKLKGEFILQKINEKSWLLIKKREAEKPSNLKKVLWPKEKYTKEDLLTYYMQVADYMLPYLKNRPIILHRFPNGITGADFYQKNIEKPPKGIKTFPVKSDEKTVNYLLINNAKSLIYAVNLASIDIHPFLSSIKNLKNPDFCVIDLDPHDVPFKAVIEVAKEAHAILEKIKVPHFCKTSGGKGLHIVIPLKAKYTFEQSKQFAELICHILFKKFPKTTSLERKTENRPKKIYLDYLQNRFGQSIVAPYSVRPRPKACVSTPLHWDEVNDDLDVTAFTIETVPKRLEKMGDIYKPILGKAADLGKAIAKLPSLA
jgi:bifunctional non-homologous end joining protein LigD